MGRDREDVLITVSRIELTGGEVLARKYTSPGVLMRDEDALNLVVDYAKSGASLSTIEAKVGLREGVLKEWVQKGKDSVSGVYREFFNILRSAIADSKLVAENKMRESSPEKWLERNSSSRVLEEVVVVEGAEDRSRLDVGERVMESLELLRAQGYDLNEIVDGGLLKMSKRSVLEQKRLE